MTKRVCVEVTAPCFVDGKDRKPGTIFMCPVHLLDNPDKLPSCLRRVRHQTKSADDAETVSA